MFAHLSGVWYDISWDLNGEGVPVSSWERAVPACPACGASMGAGKSGRKAASGCERHGAPYVECPSCEERFELHEEKFVGGPDGHSSIVEDENGDDRS